MNVKGFIKAVEPAIDKKTGVQRVWEAPEGTKHEYFNAHIEIISTNSHNEEFRETLCAEFSRPVQEGVKPPYEDFIGTEGTPHDIWLSLKERSYGDSCFNSIRLINVH